MYYNKLITKTKCDLKGMLGYSNKIHFCKAVLNLIRHVISKEYYNELFRVLLEPDKRKFNALIEGVTMVEIQVHETDRLIVSREIYFLLNNEVIFYTIDYSFQAFINEDDKYKFIPFYNRIIDVLFKKDTSPFIKL